MMPEIAVTRRLVHQLVEDLSGGLSVLLTGLPLSGRSYVLRQVAAELSRRKAHVVVIRGNRLFADQALAALALVDRKAEGAQAPQEARIGHAVATFRALLDHPRCVLLVDDADDLDRGSAGVLVDARAKRDLPLLLTAGVGAQQDDRLASLVDAAQPGVALRMPVLSVEDITQMANGLVEGVVGADTISRIATLSGGLPGLVQAILRLGLRDRGLICQDGVWNATGDLWDDGLRYALLPFLRDLDREDVAGLTRLANVDAVGPAEIEDLLGQERGWRLAQRGLIQFDHASWGTGVHLYPAALAELLRRRPNSPGAAAEATTFSAIEAGRWPANLTGLNVASITNRMRHRWSTEVARRWDLWSRDRTPATAVPLLASLFAGGADDDRIPAILEKTVPGSDPEAWTQFLVLSATFRAVYLRDLAGGLAILDARIEQVPALRARLRGEQCHLMLLCERVPDTGLLVVPDGADPDDCETLLVARAEAAIAQGRITDALADLALVAPQQEDVAAAKATLEELARILGDDVEAGVELALQRLWDDVAALDTRSISGHAYVASLGMCMLGRFDDVESAVEIVYRLADTNVFQNRYKVGLFMLGSFVADWEGRRDYAHNLALQAKSLSLGVGPFPGMLVSHDVLYTAAAQPARIWDEIDDLMERGYVAAAVYLAVAAVEACPDAARAAALIERGLASQSAVLRALTRYVDTVVSGEESRFEQTVALLREACGPLDATRASVTWALLLRERGDLRGWLDRAQAAWLEGSRLRRPSEGLFARLVDAVDLSAREVEVARHAASGMPSLEIASRMGLATRTIETHLHSIYRKTGVSSRDELRQLVRTWLSLRPEA